MSLLVAVSRAGPSVQRPLLSRVILPGSVDSLRFKSAKANAPTPNAQPGYISKMKAAKEKKSKKRKKLPLYKSLPVAQLKHSLFQNPGKLELSIFKPSITGKRDIVGQPLLFDPPENDPLRIFGLPRNLLLEFRLLSKPCSVIRKVTKDTLLMLDNAQTLSSLDSRVVLSGRAGCGKSFLLLQAVEHCMQKNWVVIYIPRGLSLVNSTTTYTYDLRTQTYLQPTFAFQTLQRMLTVNAKAFSKIHLVEDIVLEKQVLQKGMNLVDAINVAIAEKKRSVAPAPAILDGVMKALEAQNDYPVLLAVDELQALYGKTAYRDPQFLPIQSYHLSMPRLIMEYASGKRSFNQGAFVGAISSSQTTNPVSLELRDTLDLFDLDKRPISVYEKRNKEMLEYAQGLAKLEVPEKLTLEEAVGLFEIWKGQKVFGTENTFYDEAFLGKYTESGGNPRDFVWKGLLASIDV